MLLELEQECLEAYRRKVDQASRFRGQLVQAVADSEAELAHIYASLGEQPLCMKQFEPSSLKKELAAILLQLEMMQKKKSERKLQFTEILDQIHNISKELSMEEKSCMPAIDESDLSLRRLEEFKTKLHALKKEKIETEVSRLQQLKASKIMEVLLKKRMDLEQLCRQAHMPVVMHEAIAFSAETFESGAIDPLYLLEQVEFQISKVKEDASGRKDILEKMDKWLAACEEETWLEEYNRDHNRYNSGRGTHLLLKRAERARALVDKIPAMVETLREKARAWEQESGVAFSYDGVLLLSMLDDYDHLKHEKDRELQRLRDQKKLQGQLVAEQEVRFGSKPSPFKSGKNVVKPPNVDSNDKRISVSGANSMLNTRKHNQTALSSNLNNLHNRYHNSGQAKIRAGKRNLGNSNEHEIQKASARKPLSPVSSSLLSNANITSVNNTRDPNRTLQKTLPINKSSIAAAISSTDHEDNMKTPKTMIFSMPLTPATTSMKMAMTPSTPDGVEYSFEEIRAGRFPAKS